MNIGYVVPRYASGACGGLECHVGALVARTAAAGDHVTVFTQDRKSGQPGEAASMSSVSDAQMTRCALARIRDPTGQPGFIVLSVGRYGWTITSSAGADDVHGTTRVQERGFAVMRSEVGDQAVAARAG